MSLSILAQDVPQNVKDVFLAKFPTATEAEWNNENGIFVVTFYENEIYKVVTYNPGGDWQSTKTYLYDTNLPENISKPVREKYPDGIMTEITQLDQGGDTHYDIYVMGEVDFWYLQLDKNGKILKTEKIPD